MLPGWGNPAPEALIRACTGDGGGSPNIRHSGILTLWEFGCDISSWGRLLAAASFIRGCHSHQGTSCVLSGFRGCRDPLGLPLSPPGGPRAARPRVHHELCLTPFSLPGALTPAPSSLACVHIHCGLLSSRLYREVLCF